MKKWIIITLSIITILIAGLSVINRIQREKTSEWKMARYAIKGYEKKFKVTAVDKKEDEKLYSYYILCSDSNDADETEYAKVVKRFNEYYLSHDDFGDYGFSINFSDRNSVPTTLYLSSTCKHLNIETRGLNFMAMVGSSGVEKFRKFSSAALFSYVSEIYVSYTINVDDYAFIRDMTSLKYLCIDQDLPEKDVLKMKELRPDCEIDCGIIGK